MNKVTKGLVALTAALTLGTVVTPTSVSLASTIRTSERSRHNMDNMTTEDLAPVIRHYNLNHLSQNQKKTVELYQSKAEAEILAEIQATAPKQATSNENDGIETAAGASAIIKKLIKKFGKKYVTKTLPKIIYKKVKWLIGKKISEKRFLQFWNGIINTATGASLGWLISSGLKKLGVPSGIANTVGNIISTVVFWFI